MGISFRLALSFCQKYASPICIVLIFLFAAFLRLHALGNPALWIDESISSIVAQKIAHTGQPVLDSGFIYTRAVIYHYLVGFMFLFDESDFTARFISVLFGLASLILLYIIGREYSEIAGVLAMALGAVFYIEVFFSRQARFYEMFEFLFFLTLFLLYKSTTSSRVSLRYLLAAITSFLIALDTHVSALVLAPFLIGYIIYYHRRQWYLALIPLFCICWYVPYVLRLIGTTNSISHYTSSYASYFVDVRYLLVLFLVGIVWGYFKNKCLTFTLVLPALILLAGVFFASLFALRYASFFSFVLVLFSSLVFSFLIGKYGKSMIIPFIVFLIIPSNLFFPYSYVTIFSPVDYQLHDRSSPVIDYKNVDLNSEIPVGVLFSPSYMWYHHKPDFVLAFSLTGRQKDSIVYNGQDIYSGAAVINTSLPSQPYTFYADYFSLSKLTPSQGHFLQQITTGCDETTYPDFIAYTCSHTYQPNSEHLNNTTRK